MENKNIIDNLADEALKMDIKSLSEKRQREIESWAEKLLDMEKLIATRYHLDNESVNYYQREEDLKHNNFQLTVSNNDTPVEGTIEYFQELIRNQPIEIVRFPSIQEAVEKLCEELKNDEGYYEAWKANIAMAFYDECVRNQINDDLPLELLHKIANKAAHNFLKQLI